MAGAAAVVSAIVAALLPVPFGDATAAVSTTATATATATRLYHVPVAVGDLVDAAADFRQLGFTLKSGRPHANGIRNVHAKFADGTEIELITASGRARDRNSRAYRNFLRVADGPDYLALYLPDFRSVSGLLGTVAQPYKREGEFLEPLGAGPLA